MKQVSISSLQIDQILLHQSSTVTYNLNTSFVDHAHLPTVAVQLSNLDLNELKRMCICLENNISHALFLSRQHCLVIWLAGLLFPFQLPLLSQSLITQEAQLALSLLILLRPTLSLGGSLT